MEIYIQHTHISLCRIYGIGIKPFFFLKSFLQKSPLRLQKKEVCAIVGLHNIRFFLVLLMTIQAYP